MNVQRISALLGAALTLAAVTAVGATPAHAATSVTAQSTYTCQTRAPGQGNATDKVTLRMQLNLPTTVTAGQSITLGGTLTLQFNQRLYESSKDYGIRSVEGYSTTMSATSLVNGKQSVIRANRFQTSPAPITDPIVVSAPITFPPYTVPADAKGAIALGLPANGTTPNPNSSTPPTVAFTVYANADSPIGKIKVIFACQMVGAAPGILGRIPVTSTSAPAPVQQDSEAPPQQGATAESGASAAPSASADAAPGAGRDPANPTGSAAPPAPATGGALVAEQGAEITQAGATVAQPSADRSGVYVPTGLLLFGGAAICMTAVVYAGITNARLRMIKRSMDG